MKRRTILVGVVYLILLLTACQADGIFDPLSAKQVDGSGVLQPSVAETVPMEQDTENQTHDKNTTTEQLDQIVMAQLGYNYPVFERAECMSLKESNDYIVYWTQSLDTSVFAVYEKSCQAYHAFELPFYTIERVALSVEPAEMTIYTKADRIMGDQIFYNFSGTVTVDCKTGKITASDLLPGSNGYDIVGVQRKGDFYEFGECTVQDNTASFTFALTKNEGGEKVNEELVCTEIVVRYIPPYESEHALLTIVMGFNDTTMNLDASFLDALKQIDGVKSVELTALETPIFRGTQLSVTFLQGYVGYCYFNKSGNLFCFEDFNLQIDRVA